MPNPYGMNPMMAGGMTMNPMMTGDMTGGMTVNSMQPIPM